jgi:hypothetical protein
MHEKSNSKRDVRTQEIQLQKFYAPPTFSPEGIKSTNHQFVKNILLKRNPNKS